MGESEDGLDIDPHDLAEDLDGRLPFRGAGRDARVVHADVDATESLQRGRHEALAIGRLADVAGERMDRPIRSGQFLQALESARRRDDLGTGVRQYRREPGAEPARRSGDDRDAVGERLRAEHGGRIEYGRERAVKPRAAPY